MRNGTFYAGRLKKAYSKLRRSVSTVEIPDPADAIHCLAVAILGKACSDAEADRAVDRLLTVMVDWNEVRVSSALEVSKACGNAIPHGSARCQQLIDALQAIFDREHRLSLDRLKSVGRREARHYLESLEGVDDYAVASVLLWSLGGHAIPVNDALLATLREADLVNPSAERGEVQAFLERHVSAADAKEFCVVMRSFSGSKRSPAKRRHKKTVTKRKSVSKSR